MNNTIKIEDGRLFIDYLEVKNVDFLNITNNSKGYKVDVSFKVKNSEDEDD